MLVLVASGCAHPLFRRSAPRVAIHSVELTNASGRSVSIDVLALEVMRSADVYAITVAQTVDDLAAKPDATPKIRLEAAQWKLGQATAAFIDATGVNPVLNALDLVVLATISRMVVEQLGLGQGPVQPLLETHRQLETNAWATVDRVLSPAQQQELMGMIVEWHSRHPNQRYVAIARFRELAAVVGKLSRTGPSPPGTLLGLLYLDPFAGLDPTAEAIQATRQWGERAMYYGQRLPMLLSWQAQLLGLQLAAQPESKQVLGDAERFSRSMEAFAQVADQLPKVVDEQRKAGIQQILEGLASERTNWLAGLASEDPKARGLLTEARETLNAASDTAASTGAAIGSLHEFVRYVSPPKTNTLPTATNSHPFNVLDYGAAASQVGVAAKDLNGLLVNLNGSAPVLSRQITGDAEQLINRAFWLGLALILVFLVGVVLAALAYRTLAARQPPTRT